MEKLTTESLVSSLNSLTIPELVALTKHLETAWGVTAAPQTVAVAPKEEVKVEQTEFSAVLVSVPAAAKMTTIKGIRDILVLGLLEAKTFVETAPHPVKEGLTRAEADALVVQLKAFGAEAEVK